MSRSQPYRTRIPTHIVQLLDVASRITLFLVDQRGPLSFTFKDRLDNKYKTSIGPQLQCSCCPSKNDHCIHTQYVFLKIFKVSVDNPIIWQAAYVDSELSDLLAWKHTVREVRRPIPAFEPIHFEPSPLERLELPSQFLKRKEKPATKVQILSQRMRIQSDSVCPICQDSMTDELCLTFCKVKCGNNFHLECLKVWARHRIQEESKVNCPMCRTAFPNTILQELEQQEKAFAIKQSQKIRIEFNCSGCGLKNIPNNPHKCLLCTSFALCEVCYSAKKHVKHPFIKRDADGRWRGAEERRQDQLKLKNYIDSKRKQTYTDQILKKLRKIDEDPNKLFDYVASAYPYVSRYISDKIDPMKKMDFNPSDIKCFKCGSTKMIFLRRLSCGHFIDHECLRDCILKQKYYCQEDGSQFLKGYENLKEKQKQIDRKRNQEMINLTPIQFDPTPLQKQDVLRNDSDYNFVSSTQEVSTLNDILTGRASRNTEYTPDRMAQRFASNIHEQREVSRQLRQLSQQRQRRQSRPKRRQPLPRNVPTSRERPRIPRPNDIRIRNVNPSIHRQKKQTTTPSITRVREQERRGGLKRQNMVLIEALIGRKLK